MGAANKFDFILSTATQRCEMPHIVGLLRSPSDRAPQAALLLRCLVGTKRMLALVTAWTWTL
jgi:hypothetical protein